MERKVTPVLNKGMIRDISISKQNNEYAFENFNIRITPTGNNSMLSVTNERGNTKIDIKQEGTNNSLEILGYVIGHAILNYYLILFTTIDIPEDDAGAATKDRIYRIKYDPLNTKNSWTGIELYNKNLNFSIEHPIETITYYESEEVQKVYWVDGINQVRFINFMADNLFNKPNTYFDFVTTYEHTAQFEITKSYSGSSSFPSGVVQYAFTYSNDFGQETNLIYVSPLQYLSNIDRGEAADKNVKCQFSIKATTLDQNFSLINVYSIIRTSLNGTPQVNKIASLPTTGGSVSYVDNNVYKQAIDPTILLFIGGKEVVAGTLSQKDNTLFLGDLTLKNASIDTDLKNLILEEDAIKVEFNRRDVGDIPTTGQYSFYNQLKRSSSDIKIFKGGETYRFGIRFQTATGEFTPTYFIGDYVNNLYPNNTSSKFTVAQAFITINSETLKKKISELEYYYAQIMIAEATYADRTVKAQGYICPTLFNLKQRTDNAPFAISSWFTRLEGSINSLSNYDSLSTIPYSAEIQNMKESDVKPFFSGEVQNTVLRKRFASLLIRISYSTFTTGAASINLRLWLAVAYADADVKNNKLSNVQIYDVIEGKSDASDKANVKFKFDSIAKVYIINSGADDLKLVAGRLNDQLNKLGFDDNYTEEIEKWVVKYVNWWQSTDYKYSGEKSAEPMGPFHKNQMDFKKESNFSEVQSNYFWSHQNNKKAIKDYLNSKIKDGEDLNDVENAFLSYQISGEAVVSINHVAKYGHYYFEDQSIITFHTPELNDNTTTLFDNTATSLKLRIVGTAPITADISQQDIDVTSGKKKSAQFLNSNLGSYNIDKKDKNYFSWPLYHDFGDTPNNTGNECLYVIYPWHKQGSIIGKRDEEANKYYAELKNHTTAKLWYSNQTNYVNIENFWVVPNKNSNNNGLVEDIRVYNSDNQSLLQINTMFGPKTYQGNYEYLSTVKADLDSEGNPNDEDQGYPINALINWNTSLAKEDSEQLSNIQSISIDDKEYLSYDPIKLTMFTPPHIVICMKKYEYEDTQNKINKTYIPALAYKDPDPDMIWKPGIPTGGIGTTINPNFNYDYTNSFFPPAGSKDDIVLPWEEQPSSLLGERYICIYSGDEVADNLNQSEITIMTDGNVSYRTVIFTKADCKNIISRTSLWKNQTASSKHVILETLDYTEDPEKSYNLKLIPVRYVTPILKQLPPFYNFSININTLNSNWIINETDQTLQFYFTFEGQLEPITGMSPTLYVETIIKDKSDQTIIFEANKTVLLGETNEVILEFSKADTDIIFDNTKEWNIICNYKMENTDPTEEQQKENPKAILMKDLYKNSNITSFIKATGRYQEDNVDDSTIIKQFEVSVANEGEEVNLPIQSPDGYYTTNNIVCKISEMEDNMSEEAISTPNNVIAFPLYAVLTDYKNSNTFQWERSAEERKLKKVQYIGNFSIMEKGNIAKQKDTDSYIYIAELYDDAVKNRYGGTSDNDIQNNVFIPAGDVTDLTKSNYVLNATEGDTYYQRWDCVKTLPLNKDDVNNVIDICSIMVETHNNIEGRYDNRRGNSDIIHTTKENFNLYNDVYNQSNNFFTSAVLANKYSLNKFPSQITWTKTKTPTESVDTWTNITLASTLDLDGDKGQVRAIRRFNNNLIAFQDKGIAAILFNSRTQLATTEGVPIEIANSGKVDGKRYITEKDGCINKWSILEAGNGIYFIDNLNTSINLFNGQQVVSISDTKGFKDWIGKHNSLDVWNPNSYNNFISFQDKTNSDVYFIFKDTDKDYNVLCWNEVLQEFTSFYKYGNVPLMTNIGDKFIAFRDGNLWEQYSNDKYTNLFDVQQNYYVQYRVTPDPYADKVFTNIEYRADVFDSNNEYISNESFDTIKVWNEYQDTGDVNASILVDNKYPSSQRKFRIWRLDIPRVSNGKYSYARDRIRNPWINLKLNKTLNTDNRIELHDLLVTYYQ